MVIQVLTPQREIASTMSTPLDPPCHHHHHHRFPPHHHHHHHHKMRSHLERAGRPHLHAGDVVKGHRLAHLEIYVNT